MEENGHPESISTLEQKTTIQRLIDNERIIKVFVYKVSLFGWQLSNLLMYHAFVVIHTNKWWWSVEKNTEGITIQRSKEKMFVQDFYRENKRPSSCTLLEEESGYGELMDIFEWFYNTCQLHQEYNLYFSNCKDFANALFQKIAFIKIVFVDDKKMLLDEAYCLLFRIYKQKIQDIRKINSAKYLKANYFKEMILRTVKKNFVSSVQNAANEPEERLSVPDIRKIIQVAVLKDFADPLTKSDVGKAAQEKIMVIIEKRLGDSDIQEMIIEVVLVYKLSYIG